MAVITFLTFSGMGVTFLLYSLSHFWQESRRLIKQDSQRAALRRRGAEVPGGLIADMPGPRKAVARLIVMPQHQVKQNLARLDQVSAYGADEIRRVSVSARWGRHEL